MRPSPSLSSDHGFVRAVLAFLLLCAAVFAVIGSSACSGDDDTTNNFIGVTDAEAPRLGPPASSGDGGTAR